MTRRDESGRDAHDSMRDRIERTAERDLGTRDERDERDADERLAGAEGGIAGAVGGLAVGSIAGPLGALVGAMAGALGGWWMGRGVAEVVERLDPQDDDHYRRDYDASPDRLADRSYEDVRPTYQLGQVAAQNPDYRNRTFEQVEPELRRGWTDDARARYGAWDAVRNFVREGYDRGSAQAARAEHTAADRTRRSPSPP